MLSFAHQIHAVKDVGDAYTREYSSTHILKELSAPSHKGTHNKNEKEKKDRSKATMPKQRINCWLFNSFPNMQQQEKSEFNLVVMFAVRWSDDSLPFLLLLLPLLLLIIIVARCVPLSVWWLSVCVLHKPRYLLSMRFFLYCLQSLELRLLAFALRFLFVSCSSWLLRLFFRFPRCLLFAYPFRASVEHVENHLSKDIGRKKAGNNQQNVTLFASLFFRWPTLSLFDSGLNLSIWARLQLWVFCFRI